MNNRPVRKSSFRANHKTNLKAVLTSHTANFSNNTAANSSGSRYMSNNSSNIPNSCD